MRAHGQMVSKARAHPLALYVIVREPGGGGGVGSIGTNFGSKAKKKKKKKNESWEKEERKVLP